MSSRALNEQQFKGRFDMPKGTVVHEDTSALIAPNVFSAEWEVPTTELHRGYRRALIEARYNDAADTGGYTGHPSDQPRQMKALLESVRRQGVREPITLHHFSANDVELTDGTHRLMAALLSGQSTVPVTHVFVGAG